MAKLVDVGSIATYFETLVDPRHTRNRKHRLVDIAVICVAAIVCGCDGPTAIHRWAALRKDWLAEHLELANGIPSRDCIRRLLIALKPDAFQQCFQNWVAQALPSDPATGRRLIAIDGKTCRGSHDDAHNLGPLHIVSAWASEEGIALGQVATDQKSNEITAIPELLDRIALTNTIVTIDAIGCQQVIVDQIVDDGGDCVIAVKDNQPKLKAAIESFFDDLIERDFEDLRYRSCETLDEGYGRTDERAYYLANIPSDFAPAKDWPLIEAIGYALRLTTHADGRQTTDIRYYILTRYLSAVLSATSSIKPNCQMTSTRAGPSGTMALIRRSSFHGRTGHGSISRDPGGCPVVFHPRLGARSSLGAAVDQIVAGSGAGPGAADRHELDSGRRAQQRIPTVLYLTRPAMIRHRTSGIGVS